MKEIIEMAIASHRKALNLLEKDIEIIEKIADLFISALRNEGKIIFMGNGGSAADAQHLAAEFIGRFKKDRAPLAAISLTANTSILTAIGNDFDFKDIFVRQVECLAKNCDLVVGISTSGKSKNVTSAIKKAGELGLKTIGFSGNDGGELANITDICLTIPSPDTPSIQEMHILAGHIICDIVEQNFT